MARVERNFADFNGDQAHVRYAYDDVSLLILDVTLVNNGPAGRVLYTVRNPSTQAVITQGSLAFAQGTRVDDISGFNLHMVNVLGKGGTSSPQLPVIIEAGWSSV